MAELLRRLLRTPQGLLGVLIVGLILVIVVCGPWLAPYGPDTMAPRLRYRAPSAEFLLGTKQDYVNAAIARGEHGGYIVLREMLPNVVAPIVVEMTIRVAFAVMLFATLSFLGLGAQPPSSEWVLMVAEARRFMHLSPW